MRHVFCLDRQKWIDCTYFSAPPPLLAGAVLNLDISYMGKTTLKSCISPKKFIDFLAFSSHFAKFPKSKGKALPYYLLK
jgi:hypothetical protein